MERTFLPIDSRISGSRWYGNQICALENFALYGGEVQFGKLRFVQLETIGDFVHSTETCCLLLKILFV